MPFPILFGTTVTTVLHYRADCDNNSSFISTADNPQLIFYNKLPQDSTDTIERKEPAIIQPKITTRISMGSRQLQASAKVDHNAVN